MVGVCIGLVLPSALSARASFAEARRDETNSAHAAAAQQTGTLIQMLQRERGLTNIQLTGRARAGDGTASPAVRAARAGTDAALASWQAADASLGADGVGEAGAGLLLRRLPQQRRVIDTRSRQDAGTVFDQYSTVIGALFDLVAAGTGKGVSDDQRRASTWYLAVLRVGEELGRERGEVAGLLALPDPPRSRIASSVASHGRARSQLVALAHDAADSRQRSALDAVKIGLAEVRLGQLEQQAQAGELGGLTSASWFAACTAVLDEYLAVAQAEGQRLHDSAWVQATEARERAWHQVMISGVLLLCTGLIASGLLLAAIRRRAGERLAAGEQREIELTEHLRAVLASANEGIVTVDPGGVIRTANPVMEEIFGYQPGELVGLPISVLMAPEIAARHPELILHRLAAGPGPQQSMREVEGIRKNGTTVPVEVLLGLATVSGQQMFVAVVSDMTQRVQLVEQIRTQAAELQERADSLARSNAELEQFAYVASHDLQEPLRKVINYVEIIRMDYGHLLDEEGLEYMHYATDGARRMRQLIDDVLAVSRMRKERQIARPCDLNDVVAGVLQELELSIRDAGATVTVGALPVVEADRTHMHQLFLNLISNALKYRAEAPPVIMVMATRQSGFWRIDVQDNGIGFKQEYADRVFGMFQRLVTRTDYAGTGIGLAIVAKVVANHGGTVAAVSQPGAGATFTITLPVAEHLVTATDAAAATDSDPAEREVVAI